MIIRSLIARKILNSSSNYTIEIEIETTKGKFYASVPSGTSKGSAEIQEFAKDDVEYCVDAINRNMSEVMKNYVVNDLSVLNEIEKIFKKYGGNSVLAVEYAIIKAMASEMGVPEYLLINNNSVSMPNILSNVIGGGSHSFGNGPEFQEFLITCLNPDNIRQAVAINSLAYSMLQKKIKVFGRNQENALITNLSNEKSLSELSSIVSEIADKTKKRVVLGADVAANHFFKSGSYTINNRKLSKSKYMDYLIKLIDKYDIYYLEDAFSENDVKMFSELYSSVGKKCLICGDDLLATNPDKLKKALNMNYGNSAIVKPNQVGSLIKTGEFVELCKKNRIIPILSHRSQETEDSILSHLAVAYRCPFMKIGIAGSERTSKLNELFRIFK
ncbi:MAG: hypothetical protein PHW96_00175 [Candidatus Nanoarchaeia archaeon]|nr:hypothetical protein [Candidatus Nanoarchaeia archaeon]